MKAPGNSCWDRVEELAVEISNLPPESVRVRLTELAACGESPTVITLLGVWLALPPPAVTLAAGVVLGGRYRLEAKLGEGGMGTVWRASQSLIDRHVAVKLIHPALVTTALRARFASEMKILGQLHHPGIVPIFDAGEHQLDGGQVIPFFAMELIEGEPFDVWSAARRGNRAELLRVVREICAALGSAHERKIVHRDLKPSNIMIRADGQPIVVDFGIARLRGLASGDEEGHFVGSPQYAAPEQHLGRDNDFRSGEGVDIYAVGAILFEVLSGRKLLQFPRGSTLTEMRQAALEQLRPCLSDVLSDCPAELDQIVTKAVRRDPSDRFYSIAALGRAIERVAASISPMHVVVPRWVPASGATVPGTDWKLVSKIGEGGVGEVWTGYHSQLKELRVFKFCSSEEKTRTLKRELTLYRLLKERVGRNSHFITLHEVSLDEPPWYLMMDYVDARELEMWTQLQNPGGALAESDVIEIIVQVAEALQVAHESGILHRDIKPANILVRGTVSQGLHVFIADFGIGQVVTDQIVCQNGSRLGFTKTVSDLRTGHLSGTLMYLAPEILEGNSATARSDIYSLGVVFWQLLTGNLSAALDPADWPARITDPILKEFLHRCLAGSPARRWSSAGELAANLSELPKRRASEEDRRRELRYLEQAAYRRGVVRTTAIAAGVVFIISALAVIATDQRKAAERARGEIAREQAETLSRFDSTAGRRARGLRLLEDAARSGTNAVAIRSAAASVFGLSDIFRDSDEAADESGKPSAIPLQAQEVARELSHDGRLTAVAVDSDGVNGAIKMFDTSTGALRLAISRTTFPWLPVVEPGMLRFSGDDKMLALGGAATSRHVLILNISDGSLRSYIFSGSDPTACAWHPASRFLATGNADGTIRIWDLSAAAAPAANSTAGNQFDVPPELSERSLDAPSVILRGQKGPVAHLAFDSGGKWLAALDQTGYLRIFSNWPSASDGSNIIQSDLVGEPALPVEIRIEDSQSVSRITVGNQVVKLERKDGILERFLIHSAELPKAEPIAPNLVDVAWNDEAETLCAITLTDAYWLQASTMNPVYHAGGRNPSGIAWNRQAMSWFLPSEDRLDLYHLTEARNGAKLERISSFRLTAAKPGQGAQASLAVADDGQTAVYWGRRIQFFSVTGPVPVEPTVVVDGVGGVFQELLWDKPGRLLGVTFLDESGHLRLESWKTSADHPPKCEPFPAINLECSKLAVANDGRNFLARGLSTGLVLIDPAGNRQTTVDNSSSARQNGAIAAAPSGEFAAIVIDRNLIRLLRMPSGRLFAELRSPRSAEITRLRWNSSGERLAGLTEDGFLQVWDLAPWRKWLSEHHLNE